LIISKQKESRRRRIEDSAKNTDKQQPQPAIQP